MKKFRSKDQQKMYKVTCAECGKNCEVPFKPTGDRPVLCDNCFSKNRNDRPQRSNRKDFSHNKQMHEAICSNCGDVCEVPFKPTSGKPIYCSKCFDKIGGSDRGRTNSDRRDRQNRNNDNQLNEQFSTLNTKLDKILEVLTSNAVTKKTATKKEPVKKTTAKKATNKSKKTTTKKTTKKTAKKKK